MVLFIDSLIWIIRFSMRKPEVYLLPIGMDALFLILYGAIMGGIFKKAMLYLVQAAYSAMQILDKQANSNLLDTLLGVPETRVLVLKISFLLAIMLVLIFFAYCLTQGVAWAKSKSAYIKTKTRDYLWLFFRINIVWFGIFILYKLALLAARLGALLDGRVAATKTTGEYIFLFCFLYFVFISYALLKEENGVWQTLKETFRIGTLQIHRIAPFYLTFALILLVVHKTLVLIGTLSPNLSLAVSFVLLPLLTFGRLYLINGVGHIESD